jgi:hypothetical protein
MQLFIFSLSYNMMVSFLCYSRCLLDDLFFILKQHLFKHHLHLDFCEMYAADIVTDGPMFKHQQTHMAYSW